MKRRYFVLVANLLFASIAHAQVSDEARMSQEMEANGIQISSLLDSTKEEFVQKAQMVGEEKVLEQGHTFSKTEVVASLYISMSTRPGMPEAFVVGHGGSRGLSLESSEDLANAAFAYDVSLAQKASFSLKMTCRQIDGQGRSAFAWCGFSR
jgi:hypothetical protein